MKKIAALLLLFLMVASLFAQDSRPVKLALVAESGDAATAVDVLTAQFSGDNRVQLLERDQIEKVYHEQELSVGNRNDLQLGRILGADGLLLLNVVETANATNLVMRLVAVSPGVILTDGSFQWPPEDTVSWAQSAATCLGSFLPKLKVSAGNAIPISIVNLRSAIQSADELETEHQLKLLTIERLSREPRFFVLEREKMELLGEEKNLKSDESAFWDGSYLLDATVDQNGYSRDTVTINVRLTPPKGATPLTFEISGSRTNLAEVINSLAIRVAGLLSTSLSLKEWGATDEATQYLDEAKWALKWGINEEAQAAVESAWALGNRDLDCALVRVRAYVGEIPRVEETNENHFQSMTDYRNAKSDSHYVHINDSPNPDNIGHALYALEAYYQFSRTSPDGEPQVLTRGRGWNDWHNSEWYQLGIDSLVAASQVLQHYSFNPQAQGPVADRLADLRAVSRSVAQFISQSPSIHDGYFVGDRVTTCDELSHTMEDNPSIFRCEVNWGCFWQEQPEDTISLYRELMSSPVFCYIHTDFWTRERIQPRLVAWNMEDQKNIPAIWENFVSELGNSTNVLLQMEAKALLKADASNDEEAKAAEAGWWNIVHAHRDELIANNVELFYLGWGFAYNAETEAMDEEYWQKTIPARQTMSVFDQQKQYLASFTPYNFQQFMKLFSSENYTGAQAAELKPLVDAYESNMVARASAQQAFFAKSDAHWIDMILGAPINKILNPPAPPPANAVSAQNIPSPRPPTAPIPPAVLAKTLAPPEEVPTNILSVVNFIKIPYDQIQSNEISGNQIFAQRWSDGKLLFGLGYSREIDTFDTNGDWASTRYASLTAIAIFDPADRSWKVVHCPETQNPGVFGSVMENVNQRLILFHGSLFSSLDGPLKKFDFQKQQWQTLDIPQEDGSDLFSVDGHLCLANHDAVLELEEDGSTHILASTRRRPAVTALDSLDSFTSPQLFAGPDQSLFASIGNNVYRWDGNDWHEILTMNISQPPEIVDGAVIFRDIGGYGSDDPANLWVWDKSQSPPELCLSDKPMPHPGIINSPYRKRTVQNLHPFWKSLPDDYLTRASATYYNSNLYFFVEHANVSNVGGNWTASEKNGYHTKLVCLSRDSSDPTVVPLKFDVTRAQPPLKALGVKTAPWLAFTSSALDTIMHSREIHFF